MSKTKIPYADEAWNFLIGCPPNRYGTGISPGCLHCWARTLHNRRWKAKKEGKQVSGQQYDMPFGELQYLPERLEEPLHWRNPRRVFVCPQSDLFHDIVDDFILGRVFEIIKQTPQHQYLIFTKRYERMAEIAQKLEKERIEKGLLPLDHITWVASASTQKEVDQVNYYFNKMSDDCFMGLSLEPLLEPVSILHMKALDWLVIGCESGDKKRPCNTEWVRRIVRESMGRVSKLYVKQLNIKGKVVTDPALFPKDLQRRELP